MTTRRSESGSSGNGSLLAQVKGELQQARAAIELWQYAILTARPGGVQDVGPIKTKLPDALTVSVTGWLDSLRLCSASGHDQRTLQALAHEVTHFAEWAEESRLALRLIAAVQALPQQRPRAKRHSKAKLVRQAPS